MITNILELMSPTAANTPLELSIITIFYNEEDLVKAFSQEILNLDGLDHAELILVDGSSNDKSLELLCSFWQQFFKRSRLQRLSIISCPPSRGGQLHCGALNAQAQRLCFLHIDSRLDKNCIQAAIKAPSPSCFSLRFYPSSPALELLAWGSRMRLRCRQICFGDQGLCIDKDSYSLLGGFDPKLKLMEDYEFSLQLKQAKIAIHQLELNIYSSARRFLNKKGKGSFFSVMRCFLHMQIAQARYRRRRKCKHKA